MRSSNIPQVSVQGLLRLWIDNTCVVQVSELTRKASKLDWISTKLVYKTLAEGWPKNSEQVFPTELKGIQRDWCEVQTCHKVCVHGLLRIWNWYVLALFKFLNFLEDDLRILNKSFPQNETGFEYDSSIRREIQTSHKYLYNEVLLWIVILGLFKLLNLPETHSNWTHSAAKQERQLHPAEMVQLQSQIHELHWLWCLHYKSTSLDVSCSSGIQLVFCKLGHHCCYSSMGSGYLNLLPHHWVVRNLEELPVVWNYCLCFDYQTLESLLRFSALASAPPCKTFHLSTTSGLASPFSAELSPYQPWTTRNLFEI